jgi:hypothetical protein
LDNKTESNGLQRRKRSSIYGISNRTSKYIHLIAISDLVKNKNTERKLTQFPGINGLTINH